ncbi:MAG: (2Fe-2S)-binding protein [Bacillota bacterium]
MTIKFSLNNKPITLDEDPSLRLLDVLREDLHLTGVKEGCGEGECGACSVLIDGRVVNSCMVPLGNVEGKRVMTIEGFKATEHFKVIEEAFIHEGSVQCGICIPGMIIATYSLLSTNPHPTDKEIRLGLSGNLCRCTGYNMIVNAVKRAASRGEGLW